MPVFTYELIDGGYRIFRNGALYIDQPFRPGVGGFEPMTAADAESAAQSVIVELSAAQPE